MKKIRKSEVIDMEDNRTMDESPEETETVKVGKAKWSLKKKLLIGGGVVVGLVLGAVALGGTKKTVPADDQTAYPEDDSEETSSDVEDSAETPETVTE